MVVNVDWKSFVMGMIFCGTIIFLLVALLVADGNDSVVEFVQDDEVVVFTSPDYSGYGVYDGVSCRLYNCYTDYGRVVMSLG